MNTSLFELFKIGIGPSSSHTVGPMRAALRFVRELTALGQLPATARVRAELFGSLALTGIGHGTDRAVLLGLAGYAPDTIDPAAIEPALAEIQATGTLALAGAQPVSFDRASDLLFHTDRMFPPEADPDRSHPNGMRFTAFDRTGTALQSATFYSVGGGFIVSAAEFRPDPTLPERPEREINPRAVPFPFRSAGELLALAAATQQSIAELVLRNEAALLHAEELDPTQPRITRPAAQQAPTPAAAPRTASDSAKVPDDSLSAAPSSSMPPDAAAAVERSILALWQAMELSVARGLATEGILPGGLKVRRRAPRLHSRILALDNSGKPRDPLAPLDWVSLFAIAVNEENAAGGRVVTAPTNGAAGVIPAIASYYLRFISGDLPAAGQQKGLLRFFLTAAAIGVLYKENASISGAEVGCQGEVGVACSMAAGGLVAALGGTNEQVEHAAEIAMEHNLGMTCDPIGGLVQIPCIERNAMGAVKAVNACRMAMHETEGHKLSLDQVIETMYRTGMDMQSRYKETSQAGLALNIIEC